MINERERASMALLKNILDDYNTLPISVRMALRSQGFSKRIDEINGVLRMYKEDIGKEISAGVEVSMINQRFPYDEESGQIIVL